MIYFLVFFILVAAGLWFRLKRFKRNSSSINMVRNDLSQRNSTDTENSENLNDCLVIGTVLTSVTDAVTENVHTEIPQSLTNEHLSPDIQQISNINLIQPAAVNSLPQSSTGIKSQKKSSSRSLVNVNDINRQSETVNSPPQSRSRIGIKSQKKSSASSLVNVNNMNRDPAIVNSLPQSHMGIESHKKSSPRPLVNLAEIVKRNTKKKSPSGKSVKRKVQRTRK